MNKRPRSTVRAAFLIASLAITVLSILNLDRSAITDPSVLIAIAFCAWLGIHDIRLDNKVALSFTHSIGLFVGMTIGIYPAIFSVAAGLLLSVMIKLAFNNRTHWSQCVARGAWEMNRQIISIAGGLAIYRMVGGRILSNAAALPEVFPTVALSVSFSLLFLTIHSIERWLRASHRITGREAVIVSLIALLPIPIIILGSIAYGVISETALIIYGGMVSIAAPSLRLMIQRQDSLASKTRTLEALFNLATARDPAPEGESHYALVDLALNELGCGDCAALFLEDSKTQEMRLAHTFNISIDQTNGLSASTAGPLSPDGRPISTIQEFQLKDLTSIDVATLQSLEARRIEKVLVLPLSTSGEMLGQLWLFFNRNHKPTSAERKQLLAFSAQLSQSLKLSDEFATTNAELKRRVEQLARLEAIGRQVTASITSGDVYETVVYHGLQATTATSGYLDILNSDTGKLETVAFETKNPEDREHPTRSLGAINRLAQQAFDTGQVTNVPDSQNDPELGSKMPQPSSMLFTPIISQGDTIGVITLEKGEKGGFSDEEEAFIIQLASQAANALRNASLYDELQQRLKEQSLLYQASAQIAESLDTNAVALALADSLAFAVNADAVYVYRYAVEDPSLNFLIGIEGKTTVDSRRNPRTLVMELPGVKACLENRRSIQWTSAAPPTPADSAHLESRGGGTLLMLPLTIGGRMLGLVELIRNRMDLFEEEELRTVQSIAIQASIILENSDLFQQISQSNNLLSAVLNSTREGMLMIDRHGRIAVVNTQLKELIGSDLDQFADTPLQNIDQGLLQRLGYKQSEVNDLVSSLQSGKGHLPGISTYELPASERQILRRLETPVHDRQGKLIGWLIVVRDVSEEMQLEESRKHLTEMIVHDLRSPLSAILNSMELLRMQLNIERQTPIMQQALGIADRSVHQMLGLVNALLDLSKLESGQFVLASIEVDFHELIPHLIDTFLPEAEQAGVILDFQLDPALPKMNLDEEKIFRVLSNLLDNALKFTPAGGEVILKLRIRDSNLLIDVVDTGPGIPGDFREQIFNLYSQVPGTKGRRRGTGLGLAFCKLAIEAHNGEIWVEDNPGGGSRFRIRLPLTAQNDS